VLCTPTAGEQCAVSQLAKYRDKLGGLDLHAWTMMESLRID